MTQRVVITSYSIISSLGKTENEILNSFKNGHTTFTKYSEDNSITVAPVKDFNLKYYTGPYKDRRYLNRGASFALAAAIDAFNKSGLNTDDLAQSGLVLGAGPNLNITEDFENIENGEISDQKLSALWILKYLPNTATSAISKYLKIHGENITVGNACAASLQAIGEGYRKIRDGYCSIVFAGGGDSRISPIGILGYKKANALNTDSKEPLKTSMPFDCSRGGFCPGEGGAFFVMESLEHALSRGAEIYCEISGFGATMDGTAMTDPDPEGKGAEKAIGNALNEAGISPEEIDFISSHGTSTPMNDKVESEVLTRFFEGHSPAIGAFKSWIGHGSSACGAMELALSLICMKNNYLPEIRNLNKPLTDKLNFITENCSGSVKNMLIENFGFGGQNSALVLGNYDEN